MIINCWRNIFLNFFCKVKKVIKIIICTVLMNLGQNFWNIDESWCKEHLIMQRKSIWHQGHSMKVHMEEGVSEESQNLVLKSSHHLKSLEQGKVEIFDLETFQTHIKVFS